MADSEDEEEQAAAPPPPPPMPALPAIPATPGGTALATTDPPPEEEAEGGDKPVLADFIVKETGKKNRCVFLPNDTRLSIGQLDDLFKIVWEVLPLADKVAPGQPTIIASDAGTVHPTQFATRDLTRRPQFKKYWDNAVKHTNRALKNAEVSEQEKEDYALMVINEVVFLKLKTIFASVLDAADIADNWIVIDRVNGKSPAADLLIESAKDQSESTPTVVVIDSFSRLKNFTCDEAKECIEKMKTVRNAGCDYAVDASPPTAPAPVKRFYQTADFADPKVYVGQELPRPAEKAHIGADGRVPDRVVWQYFYLQTFFASGTHYILCEDPNDAPDISVLGKFGYIYANGQALVVPRLKTNIQQGKPLVMLHNTGGVTQAFASLRAGMISSQPPPESKDLLDNWIELVSPQPWAQTFGLPEILMIKELHERAPMLLDDTVVTVDTLEDGTEKTLQVLMACFSAASGVPELGLGEAAKLCVLTAWKRHMTLVHNAEKFEATADKSQLLLYSMAIISTSSSVIYGQEAALGIGPPGSGSGEAASGAAAALPGGAGDLLGAVGGVEGAAALAGRRLMEVVAPVAAAVGGAAAAAATYAGWDMEGYYGRELSEATWNDGLLNLSPLGYSLIVLPIFTALVNTVRSRQRPREKWATCKMAAMQIVCQIYEFRLRVNAYDVDKPLPPDPTTGEVPNISKKMRETMARSTFVDTCTQIYSKAISAEVSKGGALKMNEATKKRLNDKDSKAQFEQALRQHVKSKILRDGGGSGMSAQEKKAAKMAKAQLAAKGPGAIAGIASKLPGPLGKMLGANSAKIMAAANEALDDAMEEGAAPAEPQAPAPAPGAKAELPDDLVSQMTIDKYMQLRVRPLSSYLEKRAVAMSKRLMRLEMGVIAMNTAGSVLAVFKYATYISITVAIASQLMSIIDYFYIPSQLAAVNQALEQVHNLISEYDSWSLVQRSSSAKKTKCVQIVEQAMLSITQAQTATSSALPGQEEEEE